MIPRASNAQCSSTGFKVDATAAVDTVYFYEREDNTKFIASYVYIFLDEDASGAATVRRGRRRGSSMTNFNWLDDDGAIVIEPGKGFLSKNEDVLCFYYSKGSAGDEIKWIGSTCETSMMSAAGGDINIVDPEWISLVQGYDLPADAYMTFPIPLVPMGQHNFAAFSISCTTWPDTLWYQVVQSNTPMDSLTHFNWGTEDDPETVQYIVQTEISGNADLCLYLGWSTSGVYFNTPHYDFMVQDEAGYSAHHKYIGIRVASDVDTGADGLTVLLCLGTVGACEGQ